MSEVSGATPTSAIDVVIESSRWNGERVADESWIRRVVAAALPGEHVACELAIVFTDNEAIRTLNARFRGRDAPTNVLSFPPPSFPAAVSGEPVPLGDVVIAFETARTEAADQKKEFFHHVTHLLVHGVLHLLGYDHGSDADAESMEMREREVLRELGIPDPYQERTSATTDAVAGAAGPAVPPSRNADQPGSCIVDASAACAPLREGA